VSGADSNEHICDVSGTHTIRMSIMKDTKIVQVQVYLIIGWLTAPLPVTA